MAKINIWLTSGKAKDLSTDLIALVKDFEWETEHIPVVGDNVSINLQSLSHLSWADDIGWIDGKVSEREFKAQTSEVELTLEVERTLAQRLRQVLAELSQNQV